MKIITYPHYALRAPNAPVTKVDRHLLRLLENLQRTLQAEGIGVGLAAPQIEVNRQVFALNLPDESGKNYHYNCFINPKIARKSAKLTLGTSKSQKRDLEGCLSVPHIFAPVARPDWIELHYQQLIDGQLIPKSLKLTNFAARVAQHEFDHLQGILFIDRVLKQGTPIYHENAKGDLDEISPEELTAIFGPF